MAERSSAHPFVGTPAGMGPPGRQPTAGSGARSVLARWSDIALSGYWFIPLLCTFLASGAAVLLVIVDRSNTISWGFGGGPNDASATLTTVASSMITFTGVVFSITIVAFQLTSSQFSPRALRNFLRDRESQVALGVFIGTFAYAFVALAAVRYNGTSREPFVPSVTVAGCYLLVATSLVLFVRLIHHMADSLRAVSIIDRIAHETRGTIDRLFPTGAADDEGRPNVAGHDHVLEAPRAGVITDVDLERLARAAEHADIAVEVLQPVGDFVCAGTPLIRVFGTPDDRHDATLTRMVHIGKEPSMRGDAAFGFRQLVDIAERALSPGVNDPTTAVQCVDRLHDLLRRLADRPMPPLRICRVDGVARAWLPQPSYGDFVDLATGEILDAATRSARVVARVQHMIEDLVGCTSYPERRMALARAAEHALDVQR